MSLVWIDVSAAADVLALRDLVARLIVRGGFPRHSIHFDGPWDTVGKDFPTTKPCDLIPHPSQAGRWALPIEAIVAVWLAAEKAAIAAKVQAGTATAADQAVAALPAPGALDATWAAGGVISIAAPVT